MLSLDRAAQATAGRILRPERFPRVLKIVTDTRALAPGDTFLALRGERYDGHAFIAESIAKGAAALIVEQTAALDTEVPALIVADTKRAYMQSAAAAREDYTGRVAGITGSAGKTTTKHFLAQLLAYHYGNERVLATPENENNEIGVSKLLLRVSEQHRMVVVEMGARHEGDIAQLVRIARPHVGVLTNIGEAHLEIFGSRERLARTKWGLFSQGAQAILSARDTESVLRAASLSAPALWFGAGEPIAGGVWIRDEHTLVLTHVEPSRAFAIDLRLPGAHNHLNLAAAVAAALALGMPVEAISEAIPGLTLPSGRYETIYLAAGPRLIYDAYNANSAGMIAALNAFASEPAQRRIAVLSCMAELGAEAPSMHERVGAHAAQSGLDVLLVSGDYAGSIVAGAMAAGMPRDRIVPYDFNADAVRWLRQHASERDAVLIKGSRKYRMEEIVSALRRSPDNAQVRHA